MSKTMASKGLSRSQDLFSQVFSFFLGDERSTLKGAARVARDLEERFIVDGWPRGNLYGSENELARHYGVGRVLAREAMRVLEARGTARVRCGRSGGLELTSPTVEQLYGHIVGYCLFTGVTSEEVRILHEVLRRVRKGAQGQRLAHNAAIEFYENCACRLERISDLEAHYSEPRTSAEQIVNDLFQRVGSQHWINGSFLGNQTDLCDQYGVDRRVLRQAIRILESAEAAESVPGRGHGLMARAPGPTSISRLICCYFAATGVDHHQAFQAFNMLSVEAMRLAASRSTMQSLAPIDAMLAKLGGLPDIGFFRPLIAIEDRQLGLAGNVPLDLFLRSSRAFPSWSPFSCKALEPVVGDLFNCAVNIQSALTANDAAAAALAQDRKFTIIDRNLQNHVPDYLQRVQAH